MQTPISDYKIRVGVVGASGYSGELLVHLLAGHPNVELVAVTSRQHADKPVESVIRSLRGKLDGMKFTGSDPDVLAQDKRIELFFLALPHGVAHSYAIPMVKAGKRVIDLSADFRLSSAETYKEFYGHEHPAPDLLKSSAYVVPEIADEQWKNTRLVAAPGCYPTSILIPLTPFMRAGKIDPRGIVISSYSGVSGAGRKVAEEYLYCERAESSKAYGLPKHRHLSEIEEQLSTAAGEKVVAQFNPHLAPMRRGIATTIVARAIASGIKEMYDCWKAAYKGRRFVHLLPSGETPDTQFVVGTNRIDMSAVLDERTGNVVITSAEDNLLKGAGGQAVQIMNLWCGFPEETGLP